MPKKDEKKTSEEDIKQLWWRYLKESDKFKKFCEKRHELGVDYFGDYYSPFVEYLKYFGNIFEQEFSDWWNGPRRNRWKSIGYYPVRDLQDTNPRDIQNIIKSEPEYIVIAVPVVGKDDIVSISKEIKKIRDCYKKTPAAKEVEKRLRRIVMPSTRIRYDELERYLDVYTFRKQGLKMSEVMKEISKKKPNVNISFDQSEFFHYQSKAKKIINNVEKGYFPGKY